MAVVYYTGIFGVGALIKVRDLTFEYFTRDEEEHLTDMVSAIRGIRFDAAGGDVIAIVGRNGSGKTTFARILNRLLLPIEGSVEVDGLDALLEENKYEVRTHVGMVFQNPEDQIVGSVVCEDVAFGAENIGVPEGELSDRVKAALAAVGMEDAYDKPVSALSGGEKQKVAVAGVLAMGTGTVILDEATSMLDPKSAKELVVLMKRLAKEKHITVIWITHDMNLLLASDILYVMDRGRMVLAGRRDRVLSEEAKLASSGLTLPKVRRLAGRLAAFGVIPRGNANSVRGIVEEMKKRYPSKFGVKRHLPEKTFEAGKVSPTRAILADHVSYSYGKNRVLSDVSISVGKGEYVAIVGATGSGKSTLLSVLSGIMKPAEGTVYVDGMDLYDRSTTTKEIRKKIGYVFQYPEHQLFAENVYEDVIFGPRNLGVSEIEAEKRAYQCIELVGLSQDVYDLPVSSLSGGQKRRAAIAGVLAMEPEYLILDEPLSGMDPEGREEMLALMDSLHREAGITILVVTHDVESVSAYADRVICMEEGKVVGTGAPAEVFYDMYRDGYHEIPVAEKLLYRLYEEGLPVDLAAAGEDRIAEEVRRACFGM